VTDDLGIAVEIGAALLISTLVLLLGCFDNDGVTLTGYRFIGARDGLGNSRGRLHFRTAAKSGAFTPQSHFSQKKRSWAASVAVISLAICSEVAAGSRLSRRPGLHPVSFLGQISMPPE